MLHCSITYIIPENSQVIQYRYLLVSCINSHIVFAQSFMAFCYRYYQTSTHGLKNDQILIPQPAVSTFSYTVVLPVVCLSKNSNWNLCHLSLSENVVSSTERICAIPHQNFQSSGQGAVHDENGNSSALRNPAE